MLKYALIGVAATALLVGAAVTFERGVTMIDGWIKDARSTAIAERDAHWQSEIAKSNLAVAELKATQAEKIATVNDEANDKIAALERQAVEARKDSDALPNDDASFCDGLSRAGVQLLNR